MEISKTAEKEIKRMLEDLYCSNCNGTDCGLCEGHRIDEVDAKFIDLKSCLKL